MSASLDFCDLMKKNRALLRLIASICLMFACATAQLPQEPKQPKQPKETSAQRSAESPTPTPAPPGPGGTSLPNANPFPSTYRPFPGRTTLIRNATIMTASGPSIPNGSVLLRDGKIAAVGTSVTAPPDALVIDGTGKYVTPGIIDVHSHVGVYPAPGVDANSDGNELTNPVTANVWAEHSVWPQDPQLPRVLAANDRDLRLVDLLETQHVAAHPLSPLCVLQRMSPRLRNCRASSPGASRRCRYCRGPAI